MSRLKEDVEFLAGRLSHRGANTENERVAAEFLLDRFKEYTGDAAIDDFYSINNFYQLAALYYFDFLFVTLFALWSPWAGVGYGIAIFLMYMAEITAFPVMGRLLPQYETQNVAARFLGRAPRRNIVISACYDSPRATYLSDPTRAKWLRMGHLVIVCCMVAVLLSCFADGLGFLGETGRDLSEWVRWGGSTVLIGAAFVLLMAENNGEYTRGAINNAAGAAVLLELARRFRSSTPESADITLLATGAKETWLSGMQHYLRGLGIDRSQTYFINIDGVGAGQLSYLAGEGMMRLFRSAPELVSLAKSEGDRFGARAMKYRGLPTDALVPLARGFKTLGISSNGAHGLPPHWKWVSDIAGEVDFTALETTAAYVEAIVRRIDERPPR